MGRKGITKSKVTTTHSGTAKKGSATNSNKPSTIKNASTAGIAVNSSDTSRASVQVQDAPVRAGKGNRRTQPTGSLKGTQKSAEGTGLSGVQVGLSIDRLTPPASLLTTHHNGSATDVEQKYLHKKFKRIASALGQSEIDVNCDPSEVISPGPSAGSREDTADKESESQVLRNGFDSHQRPQQPAHHNQSSSNEKSCDIEESVATSVERVVIDKQSTAPIKHTVADTFTNNNHLLTSGKGDASNQRDPIASSTAGNNNVESSAQLHLGQESTTTRHIGRNLSLFAEETEPVIECGGGDNGDSLSGSSVLLNNNNNNNQIGRNVCQYCNLNCTKPSVLEKHIRSHTNERPYPCVPCGFAFKTKSNLYKHCRSRAHQLRAQGADIPLGPGDDDLSVGSDQELSSSTSGSDGISRTASPLDENMMGSGQQTDKPYKPKFHKAVLYNCVEQTAEDEVSASCANNIALVTSSSSSSSGISWNRVEMAPQQKHPPVVSPYAGTGQILLHPQVQQPPITMLASDAAKPNLFHGSNVPPRLSHLASQPYNLEQHITKLISRNEAIIDDVEPALQKKYHKITGKSRGNSLDLNSGGTTKSQAAALQQLQQFQAKLNRDDGLSSHLLANQYNNLARRASTPAGISLPNNFGPMNVQSHPPSNLNTTHTPLKATKSKQQQPTTGLPASQPLNLSKPIPQSIPSNKSGPSNQTDRTSPYLSAVAAPAPPSSSNGPVTLAVAANQAQVQQPKPVHNVSSLTTLITNKLLKNTSNPNVIEMIENLRKQLNSSEGSNCATNINVSSHPRNPERSIIKGLLLDWKSVSNNGVEAGSSRDATGESSSDDSQHVCPVCRISFRSADTLQCHTKSYCQGSSMDMFSPNTLVNLARYKLRTTPHTQKSPSPLAKLAQKLLGPNNNKTKPGNIVIGERSKVETSLSISSSGSSSNTLVECVMAPLPSPGPLLGKTRLVDTYQTRQSSASQDVQRSERKSSKQTIRPVDHTVYMVPSSGMAGGSFTHHRQMHVKAVPEPLVLPSTSQQRAIEKSLPLQRHSSLEMFGGELQVLPKRPPGMKSRGEDFQLEFTGGSIVSESPLSDSETNHLSIRTPGLFSGGKVEKGASSRNSPPITPLTPSLLVTPNQYTPNFMVGGSHFQFPPINPITAYNPLTLPAIPSPLLLPQHAMKVYGGRLIPDVPGMPGPETMHLRINPQIHHSSLAVPTTYTSANRSPSPLRTQSRNLKRGSSASPVSSTVSQNGTLMAPPQTNGLLKTIKLESCDEKLRSPKERRVAKPLIWSPASLHSDNKKSFYFNRAEKAEQKLEDKSHLDGPIMASTTTNNGQQLHIDVDMSGPECMAKSSTSSKFLRPSSLSLEPGTFTPKRHHGITPTANTLPLISPETPRPSKSCFQLYINGQYFTSLGLKSSCKPFYCTVTRPQPNYFYYTRAISMYSQWQLREERNPHPLGLKPSVVMGLYDSRSRPQSDYTCSTISSGTSLKHSQGPIMTPFEAQRNNSLHHYALRCPTPEQPVAAAIEADVAELRPAITAVSDAALQVDEQKKDLGAIPVSVFGGYESNEDYEYIKGRGYGRFVCETCGIRCRKPSMLKKHIRTHTNIRPFTCQYCCFSFKTKGNLTKHMKSKSHAKKCEELGVCPLPTAEDMMEASVTRNINGTRLMTVPGDSDSEDDSDGDDPSDGSDTEDIKARLPQEQEAARGLLSLSMTPPTIMMTQALDSYRSVAPHVFDRLGEDLSVKNQARPEIAVQKITFEFPRAEQYYSNPNIAKPNSAREDVTDACDMPMDLTKPRSAEKAPSVVFAMEPARVISSVVSITDKIQPVNSEGSEMIENALLQQYLTERAMHGTKMKQQHQQKRNLEDVLRQSYSNELILTKSFEEKEVAVESKPQVEAVQDRKLSEDRSITAEVEAKPESLSSSMDTLADIAASSAKLGVQLLSSVIEGCSADRNTTAKLLASEYLKMATQRNTLKHSDREDGDSSSDQEMVSCDQTSIQRTDSASDAMPRTVVVVKDLQKNNREFMNVSGSQQSSSVRVPPPADDGRSVCEVCSKTFQKPSQLKLHMNIHYLERKYRCEPCGVSFRTQGHLHKHERSVSHHNKVSMTSTFGVATTVNPRPFNCPDCRVAFRIHGHLAKHLRSKMHVLRLECLCKIPFGTYTEIERAGINLTAIDTTDCESSLSSLKALARQLPDLSMNGVDGNSKGSGGGGGAEDESDNEDSEHGTSNGYGESLSGNENSDRSKVDENKNGVALKRKFGTLLNGNDAEEDLQSESADDGAGGVSQPELISGNSNEGTKDFVESTPSMGSVEKRIKVT